jgi:pimeloyl-ACP methyl ester carboxylesterase
MKYLQKVCCVFLITLVFLACSEDNKTSNSTIALPLDSLVSGSGFFNYEHQSVGNTKTLRVYYFIPENKTSATPILFDFHGTGRNARDYRDAMVADATQKGFIVIAPEFSEQNYPGGDGYNLGNIFLDGDNPSANTLNAAADWSLSVIEPLFDFVKSQINNNNETYYVFGHSAGAQFAHRLMLFKPNVRISKAVLSAAGWYTFPDESVTFPYGLGESPFVSSSLNIFFGKNILIQVGENDNDPNAAGLRRNEFVDLQGINRKDRAVNFFQFCQNRAINQNTIFNWNFEFIPNTDHDYVKASENAVDFLFN